MENGDIEAESSKADQWVMTIPRARAGADDA